MAEPVNKAAKKSPKKSAKTNKLDVKNSLVNNINAKKEKRHITRQKKFNGI